MLSKIGATRQGALVRPSLQCHSTVSAMGRLRLRPGDVVWIEPDEMHWHGAAPATAMTHVAIVEKLDGKSATWLEKVSANNTEEDNSQNV